MGATFEEGKDQVARDCFVTPLVAMTGAEEGGTGLLRRGSAAPRNDGWAI